MGEVEEVEEVFEKRREEKRREYISVWSKVEDCGDLFG